MRPPSARGYAPRGRRRRTPRAGQHGFTLLEILIVLLIVGMTSAVVFPRLGTMAASFEFASQRDDLERTLNGLSYRAFRENSDLLLAGTYTEDGRGEKPRRQAERSGILRAGLATRSLLPAAREHLPPVNAKPADVALPPGWTLVVAEPIYFRGSGFCSGGRAEVYVGRLQYAYEMKPPLCRAVLVE